MKDKVEEYSGDRRQSVLSASEDVANDERQPPEDASDGDEGKRVGWVVGIVTRDAIGFGYADTFQKNALGESH
jgi:hypothetical protein